MTSETRIADWQVMVAPQLRHAVEVLDDSHVLGVLRRDWLIIRPVHKIDCDGLHMCRSGELVRVQFIGGGMVNVTRGDGLAEQVPTLEASDMIAAAVVAVTRPLL
jgi:hypothetical protein